MFSLPNITTPGHRAGYTTKLVLFLLDMAFSLGSYGFTLLLIHDFEWSSFRLFIGWHTLLLLVLRGAAFIFFGTYRIIVRYTGEKDYRNAFFAVFFSSLSFWLLQYLLPPLLSTLRMLAVVLVDFLLLLSLVGGIRIIIRLLYDHLRTRKLSSINAAIFGAGEMGTMVERVLKHNMSHSYKVVAFFDDNPRVHLKYLNGIRIFNPKKSFEAVIRKYDIRVVVIGIRDLPQERRIEFINACLALNVKVLKLPPAESWINGEVNVAQLKDINFEDLLNRPAIRLDEDQIRDSVAGKVVLVTGCAGSIGSEIVRQLLRYQPTRIIGFDQAETPLANILLALRKERENGQFIGVIGDIRDGDKLRHLFETYQPTYVFHAAAYKHVPIMEDYPEESVKVNVEGTKNLADLAVVHGVEKFVMISTDKVVNPANVMGASKRIAEIYVQALNFRSDNRTQFITTRFGNVLGSNGSVIPIFRAQIEKRLPVTVTHPDVTRFFMTIPEACQLVLEAGAMGNGGEIFVFDMGEPVKIVDLAQKMIQLAGLTPGKDIEIVFSGLRPGEKLYEELLDYQEGIIPTHHPKIQKAMVREYDYKQIKSEIDLLISYAKSIMPGETLVRQMKAIVPEFASQNSVFSILDKQMAEPQADDPSNTALNPD